MRLLTRPISRRSALAVPPLALAASQLAAAPAQAHAGRTRALSMRGADLSFTRQLEAVGVRFSDRQALAGADSDKLHRPGKVRPVERILADHGANYVRLRVWTAPPAGYSDEASALAMARRAKRAGMKVLLNLHYSDFWADPAHQTTPAAWQGQDLPTLAATVRRYTRAIVANFARNGAAVDMIQIGNEVTAGMLWPVGELYPAGQPQRWAEFTTLLKAGIAGAREGNPGRHRLDVMIHIDRGGDNGGAVWFYDHIAAEGVDFDVIGLSYYPFWHGPLAALRANLNDLATRYGKPLVVVEAAYPWTLENGDQLTNFITSPEQLPDGAQFPATPAGQAAYFEALRTVLTEVPGGLGAGFFDWSPEWIPGVGWAPGEGNPNDNLTMFDWTGAALPVVDAFRPPR